MAAAAVVGGWSRAPFYTIPVAGLACLILLFFLGRELGLSRGLAFAGSVLLGFTPVFVFEEVVAMSDVPATAWAIASVLAALRARRTPGVAALAGAAFAIGVLVRPMNALLLPALLLALPARPKSWGLFALGGIPFAAFLLLYNDAAFGGPLVTGYGGLLAEGSRLEQLFPARRPLHALALTDHLAPPAARLGRLRSRPQGRSPGPGAPLRLVRRLLPVLQLLRGVRRVVVHAVPSAGPSRGHPGRPAPSARRARTRGAFVGTSRSAARGGCCRSHPRRSRRRGPVPRQGEGAQDLQGGAGLPGRVRDGAAATSAERDPALDADERGAPLLHRPDVRDVEHAGRRPPRGAARRDRGPRLPVVRAPGAFRAGGSEEELPETWREIDRTGDVALWELVPSNAVGSSP